MAATCARWLTLSSTMSSILLPLLTWHRMKVESVTSCCLVNYRSSPDDTTLSQMASSLSSSCDTISPMSIDESQPLLEERKLSASRNILLLRLPVLDRSGGVCVRRSAVAAGCRLVLLFLILSLFCIFFITSVWSQLSVLLSSLSWSLVSSVGSRLSSPGSAPFIDVCFLRLALSLIILWNIRLQQQISYIRQPALFLPLGCHYIMRYSVNFFKQAVSEWRDCYIDYEFLKLYVMLIKKIVECREELQESLKGSTQNSENERNQVRPLDADQAGDRDAEKANEIAKCCDQLAMIVNELNDAFETSFQRQVQATCVFYRVKMEQLKRKFEFSTVFGQTATQHLKTTIQIPFLQFVYIEAFYIKQMVESNLEAERKILKKHKKYAKKIVPSPQPVLVDDIDQKSVDKLVGAVEDYYVDLAHSIRTKDRKKEKKKDTRKRLRNLAEKPETTNMDSFSFGLWVGIFIAVIAFMSFLLGYNKKSVETDPQFNRDFPPWRGIAFVLFYIWVIGLNIFIFERHMISHRIILGFEDHHHSSFTKIFEISGFFSTIFVVLFSLYALNLTEFIALRPFPGRFLALIVWGILLAFVLNPAPILYHESRFFVMKLLLRMFASPLIGVAFVLAWGMDQLVSLITPFEDMAYSICYFTSGDPTSGSCRLPARVAVFAFGCTILSYRIMQCARQAYDKGKFLGELEFFNSIKYLFSLLTLVLSYLWKSGNERIFAAWLVSAIISSIYSYCWDLKIDWGLLERQSGNLLLRDKLTYSKPKYYLIMVLNLVLRLAWVLTLSPNITQTTFGSPQLFRLVTGALEISRRGIWNLLRLEKEHLKNCEDLRAILPKSDKIQAQMKALSLDNQQANNASIQMLHPGGSKKHLAELNSAENRNPQENQGILQQSALDSGNCIPSANPAQQLSIEGVKSLVRQNWQDKKQSYKLFREREMEVEQILKRLKFHVN